MKGYFLSLEYYDKGNSRFIWGTCTLDLSFEGSLENECKLWVRNDGADPDKVSIRVVAFNNIS